jgi:hypothetical protein
MKDKLLIVLLIIILLMAASVVLARPIDVSENAYPAPTEAATMLPYPISPTETPVQLSTPPSQPMPKNTPAAPIPGTETKERARDE